MSNFLDQIKGLIKNVVEDNDDFMKSHDVDYFTNFQAAQHPRATVVVCSDSRVQSNDFDYTADNDLFMVRNIGNSFENNKGSVEYGVLHLHTPILMIIGHSECGAVKAVHSGIQDTLEPDIQKELAGMGVYIDPTKTLNENIIENVERQMNAAYDYFNNLSKASGHGVEKLLIISAIYDFTNFLGNGYGKLNFLKHKFINNLKRGQKFDS